MSNTLYIGQDAASADLVKVDSEDDFLRLLDERLGHDARCYVEAIIRERDNALARSNTLYEVGLMRGMDLQENKRS